MEVYNAPSKAQSIDIKKWKKERNKEMGVLPTTYMFDDKGRKRNVGVKDVESFKKLGWKEIDEVGKAKDVSTETKPAETKPAASEKIQ